MRDTPFVITIDTEGDDLWARPREITTHNALFLPRFQRLCERYAFRPTWLANHEMAMSDAFVEFARAALARGAAEVAMHLHAWNSPPLFDLTGDDFRHQPYLIEYPPSVMQEKIRRLTRLLEDRFDRAVVSHRAGRWGFDGRYAALLAAEGYRVDCSVTPGVDWRANLGDPRGHGGSDYTGFPARPYFFDPADIARPAPGPLLEVPMTVVPSAVYRHAPSLYRVPLLRRLLNRTALSLAWLCPVQPALRAPVQRNLDAMLGVARALRAAGASHLQLALHSSELMPGGSPSFRSGDDIERLYDVLESLFEELARWCRGMTLVEFAAACSATRARPPTDHRESCSISSPPAQRAC